MNGYPFKEQAPGVGETITYRGKVVGSVTRIDGNLCYYDAGEHPGMFIWQFHDGLNNLHSWPSKDETLSIRHAS